MQPIDIQKFKEVMQHFANAAKDLQSALWFPENRREPDYVSCREHLQNCRNSIAELLLALQPTEAPQPQLHLPNVSRGEAVPFYCVRYDEVGKRCEDQCTICRDFKEE